MHEAAILVFTICVTVTGIAVIAAAMEIIDEAVKGNRNAQVFLVTLCVLLTLGGLVWSSGVLFK